MRRGAAGFAFRLIGGSDHLAVPAVDVGAGRFGTEAASSAAVEIPRPRTTRARLDDREGIRAVDDRVFGVSDDGAGAAELALLTYRAPIPPSLGFVDAAGLPLALETATQPGRALSVGPGITLLINGATGGIGSTVEQHQLDEAAPGSVQERRVDARAAGSPDALAPGGLVEVVGLADVLEGQEAARLDLEDLRRVEDIGPSLGPAE